MTLWGDLWGPWICDLGVGTAWTVSGRLDLGWRLEYDKLITEEQYLCRCL